MGGRIATQGEPLHSPVNILAGDSYPGGEPGGGGRDGQLPQQPGPDRIQRRGSCFRVLNDLDVPHDLSLSLTRILVKEWGNRTLIRGPD